MATGSILGGEDEAIRENNGRWRCRVLAVFLVFVVMAIQYESVINSARDPGRGAPLARPGVGWRCGSPNYRSALRCSSAYSARRHRRSTTRSLLVEYAEQYREKRGVSSKRGSAACGSSPFAADPDDDAHDAVRNASARVGIGEGTEMMQPLAIAVIGGLTGLDRAHAARRAQYLRLGTLRGRSLEGVAHGSEIPGRSWYRRAGPRGTSGQRLAAFDAPRQFAAALLVFGCSDRMCRGAGCCGAERAAASVLRIRQLASSAGDAALTRRPRAADS